jgi:daunorubicin resistance ABC transporter ATP-binding subunit
MTKMPHELKAKTGRGNGSGGRELETARRPGRKEISTDLAIETHKITKQFRGGPQALAGVSFRVGWGEIFGYLGRSGSGKTTTARILTTLSRPSSGTGIVGGHDVVLDPDSVRRSIGVTMQDAALDNQMTAREHLEFVGGLWGLETKQARQRGRELLETFGLAEAGGRAISTYSGGMRRRLDIATALITRPRILFLDEPTTGLDPLNRRVLWDEIRALRDDGTTVFLTTQYLEEADELADRIAIIENGRIIACGAPQELKGAIGQTKVAIRLSDPGELAALSRVVGDTPFEVGNDGRVSIELKRDGTIGSPPALGLLAGLRDHGVGVTQFSVSDPTLEDVFVQLTSEPRSAVQHSLPCGPR